MIPQKEKFPMSNHVARLSVLATMVLAASACSPAGSPTTSAPVEEADPALQAQATTAPQEEASVALDPCAVQTQADAEALFGEPVGAGVASAVGPFQVCTYEPVDATGGTLSFMVWPGTTASAFEAAVAETEQQLSAEGLDVPGVGEKAYYLTGVMHVFQDGYYLQYVLLKTMSDEEAIAAFSQLANQAIGRLP
jgi:hypothetical protein